MKSPYFWTDEQKQLLEKAYKEGSGLSTALELLPGKPKGAIAVKACRMELTKARPRTKTVTPVLSSEQIDAVTDVITELTDINSNISNL